MLRNRLTSPDSPTHREDPIMATFALMLHEDPSSCEDMSPERMQEIIKQYGAWAGELHAAGKLAGGHKLADEGGRRLRRESGGELTLHDGPYAESKEVLGGIFLIEAASYEEAAEIARSCPHLHFEFGTYIDIRQIDDV